MPTGELADAALVLVGGVLLMLPGLRHRRARPVLPDALHPPVRPQGRARFFVARRLSRAGVVPGTFSAVRPAATVVEGEVVPDGATVTVSPDQIETGRPQA